MFGCGQNVQLESIILTLNTSFGGSDELDFVHCSSNRKLYVKTVHIGGWEHTWSIYLYVIDYTT